MPASPELRFLCTSRRASPTFGSMLARWPERTSLTSSPPSPGVLRSREHALRLAPAARSHDSYAAGRIGVLASVLLVICLSLQLVGVVGGALRQWIWLPMFFFEVPL